MKLRAWFNEITDTIIVEEYSSLGDDFGGILAIIAILIVLVVAPAFIPLYFLFRYCKKESSIGKREIKRSIGNLVICLFLTTLSLCFRAMDLNQMTVITWVMFWIASITPLATLICPLWCFIVSKKAEKEAQNKNAEKSEISTIRKAAAINIALVVLLPIVRSF